MHGTELILRNEHGEYRVCNSEDGVTLESMRAMIMALLISVEYNETDVVNQFKKRERID